MRRRVQKWEAEDAAGGGGARIGGPTSAAAVSKDALSISDALNKAQEVQKTVDKRRKDRESRVSAYDAPAAPQAMAASTKDDALIEREEERFVEGWEFVSEWAIAQEYVEMAASVVSIA